MQHRLRALISFCFVLAVAPPARADPIAHYRFGIKGMSGNDIINNVTSLTDGWTNAVRSTDVPVTVIPLTGEPNDESLQFDGGQEARFDFTDFIFHSMYGDATLEFWLKAPDQAHSSIFWTRLDDDDRNRFHISINPGGVLGMDYRDPNATIHAIAGMIVPIDEWTQIAITRSVDPQSGAHTYNFYRNGTLVSTGVDASPSLPTGRGWSISGRDGFELNGLIDEVRFSDRVLDPAEFLNAPGDTTPPATYVAISGQAGLNGWYTGSVSATLHADDGTDGSGVKQIVYRLDDGNPVMVTGDTITIDVIDDGVYTLVFAAEDNAGTRELEQSIPIKIDKTPPTLIATPDRAPNQYGWYNRPVTFTFTAVDALSGVCYVPPPVIVACDEPQLDAEGLDCANNESDRLDFTATACDDVPPSSSYGNNGGSGQGASGGALVSTDDQSGVRATFYRVDDGLIGTYTGSLTLAAGSIHTIEFWSVDFADNIEAHKFHAIDMRFDSALTVSKAAGRRNAKATLSATLTSGGMPVANKTIVFHVDGTPVGSGVTDRKGKATVRYTIPATQSVGPHTITAAFADGDPALKPATGTGTLDVTR